MFDDKAMKIFSSRDTIRQQLIDYAEDYLDVQNIDLTKQSYLSYLINVLSVLTSNLIYYNTATYREFFLIRAQQKESVLNIASMVGYQPDLAQYATAKVMVSLPIVFKSTTTITMNGRNTSGIDPFKFYSEDIPFSCKNNVEINIIMSEGLFLTANIRSINNLTGGVSNINWRVNDDRNEIYFFVDVEQILDEYTDFVFPKLKPYEFYNHVVPISGDLASISVETVDLRRDEQQVATGGTRIGYEYYDVSLDDKQQWESRDSLFLINYDENAYTYRINEDSIKLFFGNGVIGSQPEEGVTCLVTTGITRGYDGNVISGSINRNDTLYARVIVKGVAKDLPVKIRCTNPSPASGGVSFLTIDELRQNAIASVKTNSRLVTQDDFDNVSSVVSGLPIRNSIPILKRSDLKRNEICLFTDLIFQNEYVPTKNVVARIANGFETNPLRFGDPIDIDITERYRVNEDFSESFTFVSLFDIVIDDVQRTCTYYYILDSIEKDFITSKFNLTDSKQRIIPYKVAFNVTKDLEDIENDTVNIKIYYRNYGSYTDDTLICYLELNESNEFITMTSYTEDEDYEGTELYFQTTLDLYDDIDLGEMLFDFQFADDSLESFIKDFNARNTFLYGYVRNTVRQPLDTFMYSKVRKYFSDDEAIPEDAIEISTYEQLLRFADPFDPDYSYLDNDYFVLTSDITVGESDADWEAIGSLSSPFTGTFNGDGHTITGLTCDTSSDDNVGFFSYLGEGGVIRNVTLDSTIFIGGDNVGTLVGTNDGGEILYCQITSTNITGTSAVGGLCGLNQGTITNCSAEGTVTGSSSVGGFVGINNNVIEICYSKTEVNSSASGMYFGGFCGNNENEDAYNDVATISNCYSQEDVVGGTGTVIGGFVGYNANVIEYCYCVGDTTGAGTIGGFVATDDSSSEILSCFWDSTVNTTASSDDYAKTTVQLKNISTFVDVEQENKWSLEYWYLRDTYYPELKIFSIWGILYDVPVVRKDYLDYLIDSELKDIFIEQVIHKIAAFDVMSYRMLTDFVNLKFSNTSGLITNMNYNEEVNRIINLIDPETLPSCTGNGFCCAVTNDINPWNGYPWYKKEGGFLAVYNENYQNYWQFFNLSTNDIFLYNPIVKNDEGNYVYQTLSALGIKEYELYKLIYNGDNFYKLTKQMPLTVKLEVWKDISINISDLALINDIKDAIERNFIGQYGYDRPIYHSEITSVVHNVRGVEYCTVLDPPHDIFFDYDLDDFDHESILRYTPELIYILSDEVQIILKSRLEQ